MSEKLIVKNFGPIKYVELNIKKVNVLIGEQGTGKSALVKLLYLFSSQGFLFGKDDDYDELKKLYDIFFQKDTFIEYDTTNFSVIFEKNKFSIYFKGSHQEILSRFRDITILYFKEHDNKVQNEYLSLREWFYENIGNYCYVPAERIAIPTFYRTTLSRENSDQYLNDFALNFYQARDKVIELEIPHLSEVIYKRENYLFDRIIFKGEGLFLSQTSSGFQSSIPLAIVIEYFTSISEKKRFIIEEPELNLFPTTQYELIKYFIHKTSSEKNGLFLATHSPYVITSLNNMMYAFQVGQKNPEQVAAIIDKKYWLNPDEVSAYRLLTDGTVRNILDDELKQINAGEIDEISRSINDKWDKIADIEFSKA